MKRKNLDFLVYIFLFSSNKQLPFIYFKKRKKERKNLQEDGIERSYLEEKQKAYNFPLKPHKGLPWWHSG